jgi:hypothetical protein
MRKRGTGLLVVLTLVIAIGAVIQSYQFDVWIARARESAATTDRLFGAFEVSLRELHGAQGAYVATGQSPDAWIEKSASVLSDLDATLARLTAESTEPAARPHYESAGMLVAEVRRLDERARDNVRRDQKFLASDLIFMDGLEAGRRLAAVMDQARTAEAEASAAALARLTWMRFGTFAAALGFAVIVMLSFARAFRAAAADRADTDAPAATPAPAAGPGSRTLSLGALRETPAAGGAVAPPPGPAVLPPPTPAPAAGLPATPPAPPPPPPVPAPPPAGVVAINLSEAAELCVDLARVMDTRDLPALLARAARVLDAKGVILWIADETQERLRPSLSHGYTDSFVRRLGSLAVGDESVTSVAFRSLRPQSVSSPTAKGNGAIAVPLITANGCLGVLAAELRQSKPSGERTAIARVIAAQFASLVAPAAELTAGVAEEPRAAEG